MNKMDLGMAFQRLNDEMVQLKQVEKWDGKLPTYSGITNGMFSFK